MSQWQKDEESKSDGWEKGLVETLAKEAITEQRRRRRWGIFFKIIFFTYILAVTAMIVSGPSVHNLEQASEEHTALIDIKGVIADGADANADNIVRGLRAAFKDEMTKGIIIRINSPGGSPVQSGYVNDEIYRLKEEYPDIPVYAVVSDLCASGGYYIAAAADKIYADKASLVGSIGVLMNGFGFVDAMEKLGVERRLYTAGENKGFLDPFSPQKETEIAHAREMLGSIHQQFIDVVKKGRGDKIPAGADLFNGFIWTGEEAKELGLVDELGSAGYVAREVIGVDNIIDFTPQPNFFEELARSFGAQTVHTMAEIMGLSQGPQLR